MSAKHAFSISSEVAAVLTSSTIEEDRVILPPDQLDRKLYQNVMKVLTEFGGKWSRKDNAILLKVGAKDKLLEALGTGTVNREKVIRQAYYTPSSVAEDLAAFAKEILPVLEVTTVLEPSAGDGSLIDAADTVFGDAHLEVVAFEIDGGAHTALREKLEEWAHKTDFLKQKAEEWGTFDLILMNPPFQKGQALKHIKHALTFLADLGVLAAIVPSNFPEEFPGYSVEARDVPAGAFKESGTNIATKMIRIIHANA